MRNDHNLTYKLNYINIEKLNLTPFRHSSHTRLQFVNCNRVWLECNIFSSYNGINIVLFLIIDIDGFAKLQLFLGYHITMSITLKYALPYPLLNAQ